MGTEATESAKRILVTGDRSGMGEAIVGYNELLEQVTQGIYAANGTDEMLKLNAARPDPPAPVEEVQ